MEFEWDEAKNALNIEKHGINFYDVRDMFNHPMWVRLDDRVDYGEDRWVGIGLLSRRLGVVLYTERCGNTIRIISARKANKMEIRGYEKSFKN